MIEQGCVLGSATGAYMSNGTGHWVGGVQSDTNGSLFFGWSRTGGDLRLWTAVTLAVFVQAMMGRPLFPV
jgi:hypothetical protein